MKRPGIYLLLVAGALVCITPFLWTISTSLKTLQQTNSEPVNPIPQTARLRGEDGASIPISVVGDILRKPAALVKIRGTQTIPVLADALSRDAAGHLAVRFSAAPEPLPAEFVRDMPNGVAQVRTWPDEPTRSAEMFVEPDRVQYVFDPQFQNYYPADPSNPRQRKQAAWTALSPFTFDLFVLNTWTITIINVIGQTFSCALVAYGFSRFQFRGRNALFMLLLSTMMLPAQVTMIPIFMIWNGVGLIDTFAPLTVPAFFAQNAVFVFLLRQFFMGIPRDLDEAARIDGCGPIRIWWSILLPLCKPALITVAVLAFLTHWDDFLGPLIYLNSPEKYPVSLGLRLFQDQNGTEFNLLMAAALIHIVPAVLLFFVAQRYFVKGIAMTGLKA